jgi:ankyrin repeat protein
MSSNASAAYFGVGVQSIDDDMSMTMSHYTDDREEVVQELQDSGFPGYASFQQSCAAFTDDVSEDALFRIIEGGMPRPNDRMDANTRKQITEMTYEHIRNWLRKHTDVRRRQDAIAVRGINDTTPLHNVCKLQNPPADIIEAFIEAVPFAASWVDTHGWLPLHHACANGASGEVLKVLTEAYPEGKIRQDLQSRTPLHFFLTQRCDNVNAMAENMKLLLDTGAAELPDVGGMLPMHYACAYGVSPIVLAVLENAFPESLLARENKERTAMHLVMVNAHRKASPGVIRFLLERCGPEIVNVRDHDGYLPIHLLANGLRGFRCEIVEERSTVADCLALYLGAEPHASAAFLTSLQDLPDWLRDVAVVTPHVRNILNKKIVRRFPTSVLIMDLYMKILLIVFFQISTEDYIDKMFGAKEHLMKPLFTIALRFVFFVGAYFLIRELVQVISFWSLGRLSAWFWDFTNWLDVSLVIFVFYYALQMAGGGVGIDKFSFRTGVAFTEGILWINSILFLKSTYVEFSVFVGGVYYVFQRLAAFLMAVAVILFTFALMFYIVFVDTPICVEGGNECDFPHCSFGNSLLKVYTMMMGEIGDETRYQDSTVAQIMYVMYAFLVVILLSNVLIAIVTDSYEIVQNDRAAIVFWSNRLDFVAEIDAVFDGIRKCLGVLDDYNGEGGIGHVQEGPGRDPYSKKNEGSKRIFANGWKNLVQPFDQHVYDDVDFTPTNVDFWCFVLFRALAAVIILVWILAGLGTVGCLWPPQIREWLFIQKKTAASRSDLEKQKLEQLKEIQNGIKLLKTNIAKEFATDRDDILRMKTEIEGAHYGIASDLQQIRELVASLLESRSRSEWSSLGPR